MGSEITVRGPAQILEASRALQAANRRNLEIRQADGQAERSASRTVSRALRFAESQVSKAAGRRDPWRGAVPEFEPIPPARAQQLGKRFDVAAAWWRWDAQSRLVSISTADRSATATITVPLAVFRSEFYVEEGVVWYQALPAGRDRMVLVFYIQVPNAEELTIGTETITNTSDGGRAAAYAEAYISEYLSEDPREWRVIGTTSFYQDTRARDYRDINANVLLKAAVVTPSSVRIVDWPQGLESIARQKFYYLTSFEKRAFTINQGRLKEESARLQFRATSGSPWTDDTSSRQFLYVETSSEQNVQPNVNDASGRRTWVFTPNPVTSYELTASLANDKLYQADGSIWLFLLRTYGYGKLISRVSAPDGPEQDPAWGWTPAVYSFLRNYKGEFHGTSSEEAQTNAPSYDYIRTAYFPDDGPAYMLDAGSYKPGEHSYFRSPIGGNAISPGAFELPSSPNVDGAGVTPKPNRGPSQQVPVTSEELQDYQIDRDNPPGPSRFDAYPWRQGREVPVVAWDWGRPLACLLELQALGFTAGSLGLSDEEAAALAAADPAADGFRFSQVAP